MRKKQNTCTLELKTGLLLLCMGIFLLPLGALDPDTPIDRYIVDQWSAGEGLKCNFIQAMAKTPDGYLWLATDRGLVRFDGVRFSTIPFIDNGKKGIENERTGKPNTSTVNPSRGYTSMMKLKVGSSIGLPPTVPG